MNQPQPPNYQMAPPPPTPQKKGRSNGMALFLAICVALIPGTLIIGGIIAAIAIPNFQRFQSKAKQSEAKTSLAMAYTGEQAFIAQWSVATTDLQSIGISSDGTAPMRYHFGFVQPATAQWETIGVDASTHDPARLDTEALGISGPELGAPFQELAKQHCPDCVTEGVSFKMVAIGNIDTDETLDVWTIDQDRALVNVVDDTKE